MKYIVLFTLLIFCINTHAQTSKKEAIQATQDILDIISGEKGEDRDWDLFRNQFANNASISLVRRDSSGNNETLTLSLEQFIMIGQKVYDQHYFHEEALQNKVMMYNGIAQVFQTYKADNKKDPVQEGVNAYQLVFEEGEWKVLNLLWTGNDNGVEIPKRLK